MKISKKILTSVFALCVSTSFAQADTLVKVSGLSPYPDGGDDTDAVKVTECNGAPQTGLLYRNSEVEPHLEINPVNHDNMIAAWHQDRWSNGAAQGIGSAYTTDGGVTWHPSIVPVTNCAGGTGRFEGARERGSDPWLAWSADGQVAYLMVLVANNNTVSSAQVVARTFDGGASWEDVTSLRDDPGQGRGVPFNDKNTMVADPAEPGTAYAIWTEFKWQMGTTRFSKTTDGGDHWSPAREIWRGPGDIAAANVYPYPQGNQIVVLPDGTLLNVQSKWTDLSSTRKYSVIRSYDGGNTWEKHGVDIAPIYWPTDAYDFEYMYVQHSGLGLGVRDGGDLPDVAVNRNNGYVYVAFQSGADFQGGSPGDGQTWTRPVITVSKDGGDTWSVPIQVPGVYTGGPSDMKFEAEVAVRDDGTVALMYYDFHKDVFGDATLDTDVHVAFFDADLTPKGVKTISPVFDLRQAPIAGGLFPGDYMGFTTDGTDFLAAFTMTNNLGLPVVFPGPGLSVDSNNRQDVYFARITWP